MAKPLFQEHFDEVPEGESAIHRGIPKQYRWSLREHGVYPLETHLMTRLLPPVDEVPRDVCRDDKQGVLLIPY